MNPFKRKMLVFSAILQFVYGLILMVSSFSLLFSWVFNDATGEVAPHLFNGILAIFGGRVLLTKIITPIIGLLLTTILIATTKYIIKKPYNKKTEKYTNQFIFVLVAFILNAVLALTFILLCFAEAKLSNVAMAILTTLVTVMEFICLFLPTAETATVEQVHNANATNNLPNNNTAQQAPPTATSNAKKIETISTASFKMRADELFRLAKQKKISDERLLTCLNDLMLLPIDTSYEFKIKSLSRFSSHGFLTTKEISTLVCNALLTYNTETIKKRIRYLDFLHSKNLIEENDYYNVVQSLMTLQE